MRNDVVTLSPMDRTAQALVDPIRREILRMVCREPLPAGAVADAFSVSRPAISRHLRVLREAGLLRGEAIGRGFGGNGSRYQNQPSRCWRQ